MPESLTTIDKVRSMPWQIAYYSLNSVFGMLTVFSSVLVLYLNELGLGTSQIGMGLSLLPFAGVVALFMAGTVTRWGLKRSVIIFMGLRKIVVLLLAGLPLVARAWGQQAVLAATLGIIGVFALCRAIAETADYPWRQQLMPAALRGRYTAMVFVASGLCAIAALGVASGVINKLEHWELGRFQILIVCGGIAGLGSVGALFGHPGGMPDPQAARQYASIRGMLSVVRDRSYMTVLLGIGLVFFGFVSAVPLVALYMRESVGLASDKVVLLETGLHTGLLLSSFAWGFAVDRFGGKPVMLTSVLIMLLLPVGWFFMPRESALSLPVGIVLAFLQGTAMMAWMVAHLRYLYVAAVPPERSSAYMAFYYAWIGVVGGVGPLLAGWLIERCSALELTVAIIHVDQFTPFFASMVVVLTTAVIILGRCRSDSTLNMGQFMGMLWEGNTLQAIGATLRFRLARDEQERISTTERMGIARSRFSTHELIDALADPSFNVRYEAIISSARMKPTPQLTSALLDVLSGNDPELSAAAAWALGRTGDRSVILPLREMLDSEFVLLRARTARSLGMLGDRGSIAYLVKLLGEDEHQVLRVAYASALGHLRATEACEAIQAMLNTEQEQSTREELALTLARLVGDEKYYMRLWYRCRQDFDTAIAQAVQGIRSTARHTPWMNETRRHPPGTAGSGIEDGRAVGKSNTFTSDTDTISTAALLQQCAGMFAKGDSREGVQVLVASLEHILQYPHLQPAGTILADCTAHLHESGTERREYLLLALHVLHKLSP